MSNTWKVLPDDGLEDSQNCVRPKDEHVGKTVFNLLSFLAAVLLLFIAVSTSQSEAFAETTQVDLEVGRVIRYAGYLTYEMKVDGNFAHCAQPEKPAPTSGTYPATELSSAGSRIGEVRADLWFSYGSPGFDKSLWPSSWYDGTPMTDDRYQVLAHILISDSYASDAEAALHGCYPAFCSWAREYVIGFDESGNLINGDATGRRIMARASEVPQSFKAFQVNTGGGTQTAVSYTYTPSGSIELTKVIGMSQISSGNPLYSPAGAKYGLFRDEACTNLVCELATDDSGRAHADGIDPGNYWVKETVAPANSQLNSMVYAIEVKDRQTTRVCDPDKNAGAEPSTGTVSDKPIYATVDTLISKRDAETGQSIPQSGASFADAEFTVSYFPNIQGDTSGDAKFTWRFRTDDEGKVHLGSKEAAEAAYVDGDALPTNENGVPVLPIGTYTVSETKAPSGYLASDTIEEFVLTSDGSGESRQVEIDDFTNVDVVFNEQKVPDEPKVPEEPKEPSEPVIPDAPEVPNEPEVPSESEEPETPSGPVTPDTPNTPSESVVPDTSEVPNEPDKSEAPNTPEKTVSTKTSETANTKPKESGTTEKEAKSTETEKLVETEKSSEQANTAADSSVMPATGDSLLVAAVVFFAVAAAAAAASALYVKRAHEKCLQHHKRSYLRYR